MCSEEKLILTYDPLADENTICSTNLTESSTNCKVRRNNQKTYVLRDKFNIKRALMTGIEDITIYNNDFVNYTYDLKVLFESPFESPFELEVYSFGGFETTNFFVNNRVVNNFSTNITYNLKCEIGNKKFNKLEYIIPSSNNGKPVTRTLIFYNDNKNN